MRYGFYGVTALSLIGIGGVDLYIRGLHTGLRTQAVYSNQTPGANVTAPKSDDNFLGKRQQTDGTAKQYDELVKMIRPTVGDDKLKTYLGVGNKDNGQKPIEGWRHWQGEAVYQYPAAHHWLSWPATDPTTLKYNDKLLFGHDDPVIDQTFSKAVDAAKTQMKKDGRWNE